MRLLHGQVRSLELVVDCRSYDFVRFCSSKVPRWKRSRIFDGKGPIAASGGPGRAPLSPHRSQQGSVNSAGLLGSSERLPETPRRHVVGAALRSADTPWPELEMLEAQAKAEGLGRVRVRQHVNPLKQELMVPVGPLQWDAVFSDPTLPLALDIGCGSGRFLLALSARLPAYNFLGLDIRDKLVERANEWARISGRSSHVHFASANATVSLESLLSTFPGPLSLVTIQFPDPHFKTRHKKRRVVQRQLVETITKLLVPGGRLFLQSDVEDAAAAMRDEFERWAGPAFRLAPGHAPAAPTSAHQPPTTAHQPPATALQPPATAHQPPTTAHQPPTTAHQPPTTAHLPPTAAHQPPTSPTPPPSSAAAMALNPTPSPTSSSIVPLPGHAPPAPPPASSSFMPLPDHAGPDTHPSAGAADRSQFPGSLGTLAGATVSSWEAEGGLRAKENGASHGRENGVGRHNPMSRAGEVHGPDACEQREGSGLGRMPGEGGGGGAVGAAEGGKLEWAKSGWLQDNPLGVPTEREVATMQKGAPIYRVLLVRQSS